MVKTLFGDSWSMIYSWGEFLMISNVKCCIEVVKKKELVSIEI